MITFACVLRSGGRYTAEWVRKLRDGVKQHCTLPHRFVALSDVDVPCERIPLEYDWEVLAADYTAHDWRVAPKWWSKIELFRPGLFGDDLVIYSDLDNLIVGPLDAIASHPHRFTMAADPWRPEVDRPYCSAVMAWQGDYSVIFERFAADPAGIAHRYDVDEVKNGRIGDQAFIEDTVRADTFRKLLGRSVIASYKCDKLEQRPPGNGAAVVMFHGLPKMDDVKTKWVQDTWI